MGRLGNYRVGSLKEVDVDVDHVLASWAREFF